MKSLLFIISILFVGNTFGQQYWQQRVDYNIQVSLDDTKNELSAFEELVYTNNSPDTLKYLYFHLWPNAYKNKKTTLAKQLIREKSESNNTELNNPAFNGYIDSLNFKVNGQEITWNLDKKNEDICKLILNQPLAPGGKITITTPFKIKIPDASVSRMGHTEQAYFITQWYPKPAVYDKKGWHQMPYLDQGEFYSEFGSFDVSITLPDNYILAATGEMQNAEELAKMKELASITKSNLENESYFTAKMQETKISSTQTKTIRFIQDNVHDFAWFADKKFQILQGDVELPHSKQKVTTWSLFTPENHHTWKKSLEYIHDATYYYSKWNGDYPYKHVTAIDGTIAAGGGMEYPMITIIGNTGDDASLERVIMHEVGHNWFYGILGSNERDHAWMDEGMNTFNEVRYWLTKYPNSTLNNKGYTLLCRSKNLDYHDENDINYRTIASLGLDQPLNLRADQYTSTNYGALVYGKTGLIMTYLHKYLGDSLYDQCAQTYFNEWKFKHPQPEDMKAVYERVSGKKLDWIFDELIKTTNHTDYKIACVKERNNQLIVKVKNRGAIHGPALIQGYVQGQLVESHWSNNINHSENITFNRTDIDNFQIDSNRFIPEINRTNNVWDKDRLFHKLEPLHLQFLTGARNRNQTIINYLPLITGNHTDKTSLGILFHNYMVEIPKFQYAIAPMYAFGSKSLTGFAEFSYNTFPKHAFNMMRIGTSVKSYGTDSISFNRSNKYVNVSPYIYFTLGKFKAKKDYHSNILIQSTFTDYLNNLSKEQGAFARYRFGVTKLNFSSNLEVRNEWLQSTVAGLKTTSQRLLVEADFKWNYTLKQKKHPIHLRLFAGNVYQFKGDSNLMQRQGIAVTGMNGTQDFFFEHYYNNRFGAGSMAVDKMGNVRTMGEIAPSKQVFSANTFIGIPKLQIIGVYIDYANYLQNQKIEYALVTGLGIKVDNYFGLYFPIYQTSNLGDLKKNYGNYIRLTLQLNFLNSGIIKK